MNHWPFIIGSYAVGILGTAGLSAWAWATMRKAEAAADALRKNK